MIAPVVNSHMDNHQALERTYRDAIYEVDLSGGPCRFTIGEALPPLARRPFALLTAHNPGLARPSAEQNERANQRLEQRLVELSLEYCTARGMSPEGAHVEPSFAVFGVSREFALGLAADFEQAAIVWFDGETAQLAWTAEAPPAAAP